MKLAIYKVLNWCDISPSHGSLEQNDLFLYV